MRLNESTKFDGLSQFQQNLMYKDANEYTFNTFITKDGKTSIYQFASFGDGYHFACKEMGHKKKTMTPAEIKHDGDTYHIAQLDSLSWIPSKLAEDLKVFVQATDEQNELGNYYEY